MSIDPIFDEKNEVKSSIIKWGKVGDWFKGTLVDDTRLVPNRLSPNKGDQRVYELKAQGGSFHNIIDKVVQENSIEVKAGEFWSIFAGKVMQSMLRNIKIGQIIGFRFTKEKENSQPGYNATKIIKVYPGAMDPDYHGETASDMSANLDAFDEQ